MKKSYIIAIIIGLSMILIMIFLIPKLTRPYPLKPIESHIAPAGSSIGLTVLNEPPAIRIISDKNIQIFCEPGLFFRHDVLWIVEYPSKDPSAIKEYRLELPEFRSNSKIQPLGSRLPKKVQEQADKYNNE